MGEKMKQKLGFAAARARRQLQRQGTNRSRRTLQKEESTDEEEDEAAAARKAEEAAAEAAEKAETLRQELHRQMIGILAKCSRQRLRYILVCLRRLGGSEGRVTPREISQTFQENEIPLPPRSVQVMKQSYSDNIGIDYEKLWTTLDEIHRQTGGLESELKFFLTPPHHQTATASALDALAPAATASPRLYLEKAAKLTTRIFPATRNC